MSAATRFHPWLLDVVACPACAEGLQTDPRGVLRCMGCGCLYPVIAGVAVLVVSPDRWVAQHRESILATLAEHSLIREDVLEMVSIFSDAGGSVEARRWSDDWVASEEWDEPWPEVPEAHGESFGAFVSAAHKHSPNRILPEKLAALEVLEAGDETGTCLELGVGAGAMAVELAPRVERLIIADLSLRAVLIAHNRCVEAGNGEVCAAILDADRLRLHADSVRAVVAANVIDLLEYPDDFVAAAANGLCEGGALALSTPDPTLGDPEAEDVIDTLLSEYGLSVTWSEAHLPWIRPHRSREWQVYFVRALLARL